MSRKEIRDFLGGFFKRPKSKWEAWLAFWDRVIVLSFTAILSLSAFLTDKVGSLVFIGYGALMILLIFYFLIAKEK